jgi:hypothetical protein
LDFGTQELPRTCGFGEEDVEVDRIGKPTNVEEGDASPEAIISFT